MQEPEESENTFHMSLLQMFPSTSLLFLRLADDFDYCSVICTAFAAFMCGIHF